MLKGSRNGISVGAESLTCQQPLDCLPELSADPEQDLAAHLNLPMLHLRHIFLANCEPVGKFLLRHIESAQLTDAPSKARPVYVRFLDMNSIHVTHQLTQNVH